MVLPMIATPATQIAVQICAALEMEFVGLADG